MFKSMGLTTEILTKKRGGGGSKRVESVSYGLSHFKRQKLLDSKLSVFDTYL